MTGTDDIDDQYPVTTGVSLDVDAPYLKFMTGNSKTLLFVVSVLVPVSLLV